MEGDLERIGIGNLASTPLSQQGSQQQQTPPLSVVPLWGHVGRIAFVRNDRGSPTPF